MKGTLGKATRATRSGVLLATNFLAIAAAGQGGQTVTIGDTTWELDTEGNGLFVTEGNTAVDVSGGSTVQSEGTLTIAEPVTADNTMTIGTTVYTFKAGATAAAGQIGLGANEAATKLAIVAAINGTDGFNTAHTLVTAAAFAGDDCVLTARAGGTAGDAIATTETFTHVSNVFDAATLGTTTAGVDPTAAEVITALTAAFLADPILDAYAVTGGLFVIDRRQKGAALECTETLAGSGNAWQNAVMIDKAEPATDQSNLAVIVEKAATAADVTAGFKAIAFNRPPVSLQTQVRTAAGVAKAWDGAATINGSTVIVSNAGSTDWAATDLITLVVGF